MAHTEKCRGCMYENACDYINCRINERKKIRNQVIDECLNAFVDCFGHDCERQKYYKLLKQMKTE